MGVRLNPKDKGIGHVPRPIPLSRDPEGKPNSASIPVAVADIHSKVSRMADAINGRLSIGDGSNGSKMGNFDGCFEEVLTPVAANDEFAIRHHLGRLPVSIKIGLADKEATIYVSRQGSWTDSIIYLKCSASSATLRLEVQ